jgi:hypothetical protein
MSTQLRDLIERAILTDDGEVFWPVLAYLERLDAEAATLPKRKREPIQAQLAEARLTLLFDIRRVAETLGCAVERQAAVERIASGRRPVQPTPADENARAGGRRG